MSKPVRVARGARAELRAAARWYELRREGLGAEFLSAADRAVDRIRRFPTSGGLVVDADPSLGIRHLLFEQFPYAILYVELPQQIRIIAFAHTSRAPGYWKSRAT